MNFLFAEDNEKEAMTKQIRLELTHRLRPSTTKMVKVENDI